MKKFLQFVVENKKSIIILFAFILAILCAIFGISSCGVTKAIVRNNADSTSTTITVSTSNPTTVSVDPNVRIDFNKDTTKIIAK